MSKANNLKDFLIDLADAIREKKNKTGLINPQDFSAEIKGIIAGDVQIPNVSGTLVITGGITEEDYEALKAILGHNITIDAQGGVIIKFADPEVLRVLLANGVGDGMGITKEAAAAVTDIRAWFQGNTAITSFNEFEMFTGVTSIGTEEWSGWKAAFKGCSELESITLPPSLSQIGYDVFRDCVKLTSVNLYNVTRIWHQAFFNCNELHIDVVIPNASVVGESSFSNSGINRVLDLGSITSLAGGWGKDEGVFRKCKSLTVAILPETLTNIGIQVFAGCEALEALIVKNPTPPTCGDSVLAYSYNCKIYVPDASVTAYREASGWSTYADRIKPLSEYVES